MRSQNAELNSQKSCNFDVVIFFHNIWFSYVLDPRMVDIDPPFFFKKSVIFVVSKFGYENNNLEQIKAHQEDDKITVEEGGVRSAQPQDICAEEKVLRKITKKMANKKGRVKPTMSHITPIKPRLKTRKAGGLKEVPTIRFVNGKPYPEKMERRLGGTIETAGVFKKYPQKNVKITDADPSTSDFSQYYKTQQSKVDTANVINAAGRKAEITTHPKFFTKENKFWGEKKGGYSAQIKKRIAKKGK